MWKRLLLVTAVSAAMSFMAMAANLTVGFSQVGSESGWRAAETNVAKEEAAKRGITPEDCRWSAKKQENQIKSRALIHCPWRGRDLYRAGGGDRLGAGAKKKRKRPISRCSSLDRSIDVKDKSLYMTTVTANNVLEGQLIGDWLVKNR